MELLHFAILLVPMFVLMAFGLPLFLSMGITCLLYALLFDVPLMILAQSFVRGLGSYDFLALPFFFLAGDLMNAGGITNRLLAFSSAVIGPIRGSLSHVNIVASMVFSGVSGSAIADTSAIGSILIPAMKKEGYPAEYAAAVTAASSAIGPVIPPSFGLVIYGLISGASIGKLFLAGAIPGFLMGVYLLVASFIISYHRRYPASPRIPFRQVLHTAKDGVAALIMPLIIIGGIATGIVTPTESGVLAVVYGLVLGIFVYKGIKFRELMSIFSRSMVNSAVVLIIVSVIGLFAWIIANMGLGEALVRMFTSMSTNKWVVLIILNLFFIIWGTVLDPLSATFILIPIFLPLVESVGIDLVHFGVVIVINLAIGMVTPPVGGVLYLATAIAKADFVLVMKEIIPFLIALILILITCTFLPGMVLWLPNLLIK